MMTREEMAVLGHAYWDGKTIQFRATEDHFWEDWDEEYCPNFSSQFEFRIKPEESNTITICALLHKDGTLVYVQKDSIDYRLYMALNVWMHFKPLDQTVVID